MSQRRTGLKAMKKEIRRGVREIEHDIVVEALMSLPLRLRLLFAVGLIFKWREPCQEKVQPPNAA